ncbi:aminotransferase [Nitzschia inconspicua]|uniref:Aminotransferase n=1 Tax=Nitzschia inconspicua TaxID=303405 RepID=A0A9K3KEI6_9STRA|nr:aminotransferase [Nitzschia inconspicua]
MSQRIHLNHAGASPPPQSVTDRVLQHSRLEQELGGYAAQNAVSKDLDQVYEDVANLIHARSSMEIALVESATVGWTKAFYAMVQQVEMRIQREGRKNNGSSSTTSRNPKVILISEAEYAANVVAACQWARDHQENNWIVLAIPSSSTQSGKSTGMLDLNVFEKMLSGNYEYKDTTGKAVVLEPSSIAMVCITHVPTNSGIINPVESIGNLITAYNQRNEQGEGKSTISIRYLVDACQSVGQLDVNVQKIQCHALVATGRKYLRGPRGTGFLYMAKVMLESGIMPTHVDHFGCPVLSVPLPTIYQNGVQLQQDSVLQYAPLSSARRFEFWESNIANRLGLGVAVRYAMERGQSQIEQRILQLSVKLRTNLSLIQGLRIHHEEWTTCGIVTFSCDGFPAKEILNKLWERGFELSVVPTTSTPMDSSATQVPDLVRASLTYINTDEDISTFSAALAACLNPRQKDK